MRRSASIQQGSKTNWKTNNARGAALAAAPLRFKRGPTMEELHKSRTSSAVKRRYNQKAYKSITIQIKPELAARIQAYKDREAISMPELLTRAMDTLEK